jgi:hypothetical protein
MKTSEILRRARTILKKEPIYEAGNGPGLCLALTKVVYHQVNSPERALVHEKAFKVKQRIRHSLDGLGYAEPRLYRQLFPGSPLNTAKFVKWREENRTAVKQWRLRWLDALIAEYKAKGD